MRAQTVNSKDIFEQQEEIMQARLSLHNRIVSDYQVETKKVLDHYKKMMYDWRLKDEKFRRI